MLNYPVSELLLGGNDPFHYTVGSLVQAVSVPTSTYSCYRLALASHPTSSPDVKRPRSTICKLLLPFSNRWKRWLLLLICTFVARCNFLDTVAFETRAITGEVLVYDHCIYFDMENPR
jgi:hypothetical protein